MRRASVIVNARAAGGAAAALASLAALASVGTVAGCGAPRATADAGPRGDGAGAIDAAPGAPDAGGACGGAIGPTGVLTAQHLSVGGADRTYVLSVPTTASASAPLPVVFVFHGDGGTGAEVRTALGLEAPAAGAAIFVYPDGAPTSDGGWWDLTGDRTGNRDIPLFDALLADVRAHYCVDATRVFATGFSRGGFFVNHLACQHGDALRAIAPQSGGGPFWPDTAYNGDGMLTCPTPPVPAMIIHGNADTTVPNTQDPSAPDGGWQAYYHWVYWNHAAPRAGLDYAADAIAPSPCAAARGLPADHPVIRCFVDGLGHAPWSGEAAAVWGFFAAMK